MKKLFTVVILLVIYSSLKASHIMGGEITYKHVAGDSFDVTVKLYRDCNGIAFSTIPLTVTSSCSTFTVIANFVSYRDITGVPPSCTLQSRCGGTSGIPYGIEEHIFKKRVALAGSCCDYTLSANVCCRNCGISCVTTYDFYVESKLDKCKAATNTSPFFTNTARLLLPVGTTEFISYKATDPDGDLITYELTPPLYAASSQYPYLGNWSYKKPLTFQDFPNSNATFPGGFRLDSLTGNLVFKPVKNNEVTFMAIKATEWRKINGKYEKIGEITRDLEIIILTATGNNFPEFGEETNEISICDTLLTFCKEIPIADIDSTDTLSFAYTSDLKNITYTNIGTLAKPVIKVCYTPIQAELTGDKPLLFSVAASDNKCPIAGLTEKTFLFKVYPYLPDSFTITKALKCRVLTAEFKNKTTTIPKTKINWEINSPKNTYKAADTSLYTLTLNDTGWHKIKMTVSAKGYCDTRVYIDSIYNSPANFMAVDIGRDSTVCFNSAFAIKPTIKNGTAPFKYKWNTLDSTPVLNKVLSKGFTLFYLELTDANNCFATDTTRINYYNPVVTIIADTAKCINDTLTLNAVITDAIKPIFSWAGFPQGKTTIAETANASKTFSFSLKDSSGCGITKTHNVIVYNPLLSFNSHPNSSCEGDSITLSATTAGGLAPLTVYWSTFSKSGNAIKMAFQKTGKTVYSATLTDAFGCSQSLSDSIFVNSKPQINITPPGTFCETYGMVILAPYATPVGGIWTGTGVTGNSFNTTANGKGVFSLGYYYTASTGCSNSGSTNITVVAAPKADFTVDSTKALLSHTFAFTNTSVAEPADNFNWNFGDPNSASNNTSTANNPNHKFSDTGLYSVKLKVSGGICPSDSILKTNYIRVYLNTHSTKSVHEIKNDVKIYPNPAQNFLTIEAGFIITDIRITDMLGRELKAPWVIENGKAIITIAQLAPAAYSVKAIGEDGEMVTSSFIISL